MVGFVERMQDREKKDLPGSPTRGQESKEAAAVQEITEAAAEEAAVGDSLDRDNHQPSRRGEAPQGAAEEGREKELRGVALHVPASWGYKRATMTPILRSKLSSKQ